MYEWRWQTAQLAPTQWRSSRPRWTGQTALTGQTLLLWAEQGLGDTLQFARFIPRVADLAGKVIVQVPAALCRLLASVDPRVTVVSDDAPPLPHDCHCPLMSLPLALGIDGDVGFTGKAYLHADAAPAGQLQLPAAPGPLRIGLAWAGRKVGAGSACNPGRDIALAALLPLTRQGAQLICLQKEITPAEAALLADQPGMVCLPQALADFADTAIVIEQLDLVISVDTAIAHLAGALGKPCWLLLRHAGEWRWQRTREDSPWYPGMRLFRQQQEGDWDEVIQRVSHALAERMAQTCAPAPSAPA
ncbi:glycosyltransferase family 9 protein [Silvimonas iriomotensis]|uniref:glycosyltransferase family 9 protein n=1 Tax=Silvimonas iriomotensis TaxID=449662 RepID=UPI001667B666|nr:glycosyltransferase family 9 protein [Silvimonas iriomotensis]